MLYKVINVNSNILLYWVDTDMLIIKSRSIGMKKSGRLERETQNMLIVYIPVKWITHMYIRMYINKMW